MNISYKPFITIDFEASRASDYAKHGYNIVAIDVLRATSTIIVALAQGAREVIPSTSIEETKRYKTTHGALTIGERQGIKLKEFDFTNSPYDLSQIVLKDKTLAITSTTGTPLIANSLGAPNILIGSTINAHAVSRKMQRMGGNWAIIGAGNPEEFLEDQIGCVMIANHFIKLTNAETDKKSKKIVNDYSENEKTHILRSRGTQILLQLGRKCDIDFVLNASNKYTIVPMAKKLSDQSKERISIIL